MSKFKFKTNLPKGRPTINDKPSLTKQSFENDANPNTIMQRHLAGGPLGNPNNHKAREPRWGNMPSETFHEMLNMVTDVGNAYRQLPPRIKSRFGNPYQVIRFVEDEKNQAEAIKLGLIHDPVKLEEIQAAEAAEKLRKEQEAAGQQTLTPKADDEAQPSFRSGKPPPVKGTPFDGGGTV